MPRKKRSPVAPLASDSLSNSCPETEATLHEQIRQGDLALIRLHEQLHLLAEKHRLIMDALPDLLLIIDEDLQIAEAEGCLNLLGISHGLLQGLPLKDILADPCGMQLCEFSQQLKTRSDLAAIELVVDDQDETLYLEARGLLTSQGSVMLLLRDTSALRRALKNADLAAYTDTLTGLPNRLSFEKQLTEKITQLAINKNTRAATSVYVLRQAQDNPAVQIGDTRLALFIFDLDRFKVLNDTIGQAISDQILMILGARLRALNSQDIEFFRLGSDQFAAIVSYKAEPPVSAKATPIISEYVLSLEQDPVAIQAEKLLQHIATPLVVANNNLSLSCSLGIALYGEHGSDTAGLTLAAELAMYQAKAYGRSRYIFYSPSFIDQRIERLRDQVTLRRMLQANAIEGYFEPQFDLVSGALRGFELYMHTEDKNPQAFQRLAEHYGMRTELAQWAVQQAIAKIEKQCNQRSHIYPISVNLLPDVLMDARFIDWLKILLQPLPHVAYALRFELDARLLPADLNLGACHVSELSRLGIKFVIDEFGEQTQLALIPLLPFEEIKLCGQLTQTILQNSRQLSLIEAIVAFGHSLSLPVCATHIPTLAVAQLLTLSGVVAGQGPAFEGLDRESDALDELIFPISLARNQ